MTLICFIGKSPAPTARVFGEPLPDLPLPRLEEALAQKFGIPDALMQRSFENPDFEFAMIARAKITAAQAWTWIGHYRSIRDTQGRPGSYLAEGLLLRDEIVAGAEAVRSLTELAEFADRELIQHGRLRPHFASGAFAPPPVCAGTGAKGRDGLGTDHGALLFCNTAPDDVADLIDAAQSNGDFSRYDRLVFSASPPFAHVLNANTAIDRGRFAHGALQIDAYATSTAPPRERDPEPQLESHASPPAPTPRPQAPAPSLGSSELLVGEIVSRVIPRIDELRGSLMSTDERRGRELRGAVMSVRHLALANVALTGLLVAGQIALLARVYESRPVMAEPRPEVPTQVVPEPPSPPKLDNVAVEATANEVDANVAPPAAQIENAQPKQDLRSDAEDQSAVIARGEVVDKEGKRPDKINVQNNDKTKNSDKPNSRKDKRKDNAVAAVQAPNKEKSINKASSNAKENKKEVTDLVVKDSAASKDSK